MSLTAGATIASAAVTQSQFPPRTVRDLIEICAPAKEDPMMTAAINYCHAFAQGAVLVDGAHEGQPSARKLFCLPAPQSAEGSEINKFIAWANALPSRLDCLAGGLIYDKVKKDQAASYSAGYQAGATRQPPNPTQ